jgi:hypothetical protein
MRHVAAVLATTGLPEFVGALSDVFNNPLFSIAVGNWFCCWFSLDSCFHDAEFAAGKSELHLCQRKTGCCARLTGPGAGAHSRFIKSAALGGAFLAKFCARFCRSRSPRTEACNHASGATRRASGTKLQAFRVFLVSISQVLRAVVNVSCALNQTIGASARTFIGRLSF